MDKFEIIEDILQYKHLSIFKNKVIYLGYDIGATKTEQAILQTLIQNTKYWGTQNKKNKAHCSLVVI